MGHSASLFASLDRRGDLATEELVPTAGDIQVLGLADDGGPRARRPQDVSPSASP